MTSHSDWLSASGGVAHEEEWIHSLDEGIHFGIVFIIILNDIKVQSVYDMSGQKCESEQIKFVFDLCLKRTDCVVQFIEISLLQHEVVFHSNQVSYSLFLE